MKVYKLTKVKTAKGSEWHGLQNTRHDLITIKKLGDSLLHIRAWRKDGRCLVPALDTIYTISPSASPTQLGEIVQRVFAAAQGKGKQAERMSQPAPNMAALVKQLYSIADELSESSGRSFTPDGHMVGSIGEVFAKEMYGLELLRQSAKGHDAKKGNLLVQVKATSGDRVALRSEPDHLLVLKIDIESGTPTEIFNGPGRLAWERSNKLQKNGQKQISLSKLRKLMSGVPESQKLNKIEKAV